MDRIKHLDVFYHERKVGTLALYQKYLAAFAYEQEWIETGFPISPFSLPLEKKVFVPRMGALSYRPAICLNESDSAMFRGAEVIPPYVFQRVFTQPG